LKSSFIDDILDHEIARLEAEYIAIVPTLSPPLLFLAPPARKKKTHSSAPTSFTFAGLILLLLHAGHCGAGASST
jgi:hypothetical protein